MRRWPNWTTTASKAWHGQPTERPSHRRHLASTPGKRSCAGAGVYATSNGKSAPGDGSAKTIDVHLAWPGAAADCHAEQAIEAPDEFTGFVDAMFVAPLGLGSRAVAANESLRYARSMPESTMPAMSPSVSSSCTSVAWRAASGSRFTSAVRIALWRGRGEACGFRGLVLCFMVAPHAKENTFLID